MSWPSSGSGGGGGHNQTCCLVRLKDNLFELSCSQSRYRVANYLSGKRHKGIFIHSLQLKRLFHQIYQSKISP